MKHEFEIELVIPSEEHEYAVLEYKTEHLHAGENVLYGAALLDRIEKYDDWLKLVRGNTDKKTVHSGWVTADTFLALRHSDRKLIGAVEVRRELNDFIRNYGGNIGYGVRPSERRRGYATQMLRLALEHCRRLVLTEVFVSCHVDNAGSRRTIEKCGGKQSHTFLYEEKPSQMFRIILTDTDAL